MACARSVRPSRGTKAPPVARPPAYTAGPPPLNRVRGQPSSRSQSRSKTCCRLKLTFVGSSIPGRDGGVLTLLRGARHSPSEKTLADTAADSTPSCYPWMPDQPWEGLIPYKVFHWRTGRVGWVVSGVPWHHESRSHCLIWFEDQDCYEWTRAAAFTLVIRP